MKKNKRTLIITIVVIVIIGVYLAVNHKEVKQSFMDGLNDGKAEKAKENK
jgi:hypothetical protein